MTIFSVLRGAAVSTLGAVAFMLPISVPFPAQARPAGLLESVPQAQAASSLQRAQQLLGQGEFAEAAALLETVTEEQADNGVAWVLLGNARRGAGDLDGALAAYIRAAELPTTEGSGAYNAATVAAQNEDLDSAFERLLRLKAAGAWDTTVVAVDPNAANLRDDPRYPELFPTAEAFDDPFVEEVEIVREWRGEAAGDQFGWIARNIGDVDGDGVNDVTTSAPTATVDDNPVGKIYVYSSASGELLWSATGPVGGNLGQGIEAAGDVDADGTPDVIAGSPATHQAWVYSGDDGRVLLELQSPEGEDGFGGATTDVGDLNGDGHDDLLVGASLSDVSGEDAGSAFVFSGADGALLLTLRGEAAGDNFGSAVGGASDLDTDMFVVGAGNAAEGRRGRGYVYEGLDERPKFVVEPDEYSVNLGQMFVSIVGDIDGDGTLDVYVADWASNMAGRGTGAFVVHSGDDGKLLHRAGGEAPRDGLGIGIGDAGDVDGDGHDDLIVGAWQHASAAPAGGKVYLYSGGDGSTLRTYTGKVMGETFGFDATGMGDVDGDGSIDFLITSAWSAVNGPRSGRMFILSGAR